MKGRRKKPRALQISSQFLFPFNFSIHVFYSALSSAHLTKGLFPLDVRAYGTIEGICLLKIECYYFIFNGLENERPKNPYAKEKHRFPALEWSLWPEAVIRNPFFFLLRQMSHLPPKRAKKTKKKMLAALERQKIKAQRKVDRHPFHLLSGVFCLSTGAVNIAKEKNN